MKVTKELLERIGACSAGVEWFFSKGQDAIPVSTLRQMLEEDRKENRVTEKEYYDFISFTDNNVSKGEVILRGDDYTLLSSFRVKAKTCSETYESYDLAILHKNIFIESEVKKFASSLSVLEKSLAEGGNKVKILSYPQSPKEGKLYEIHDPRTGKYKECYGKDQFNNAIAKILEKERKLLQDITQIEQQIIDNENGSKGWVKYDFITTGK